MEDPALLVPQRAASGRQCLHLPVSSAGKGWHWGFSPTCKIILLEQNYYSCLQQPEEVSFVYYSCLGKQVTMLITCCFSVSPYIRKLTVILCSKELSKSLGQVRGKERFLWGGIAEIVLLFWHNIPMFFHWEETYLLKKLPNRFPLELFALQQGFSGSARRVNKMKDLTNSLAPCAVPLISTGNIWPLAIFRVLLVSI